jgi:hypothetical protein
MATKPLQSKLQSNEIIFKRLIEQLKFDRIPEEEWYDKKTPAYFTFEIGNNNYSIYYNDVGKYVICSNFKGGCSISKKQSKPMDLADIFEEFNDKYDNIKRSSMEFVSTQRIYSYWESMS